MTASTVSCPFDQWGIDIVGPFPMATGQRKFLLVAVDYFSKWAFTSVEYPQSNGQAKVANWKILRILRVRLDHVGGSWADELPGVLWAICTTPKEGMGVIPFHLIYGGEAVIPVEVRIESDRLQQYSEENAERRLLELNLVDKVRAKAAARLTAYRQRMR
ncbi:uncharacterized protein LOC121999237 [Zingiber officinale]|uniref:uncharacterized protein LOC121999237 n=1 Tax=Zingiber officinale TaxID=94328 RepID=UPI001C4A7C17|nr:uncharacterized protein LOC121999237 [Zingiber officinale]